MPGVRSESRAAPACHRTRRSGATRYSRLIVSAPSMFQSSPDPKARCNFSAAMMREPSMKVVLILTGPEGMAASLAWSGSALALPLCLIGVAPSGRPSDPRTPLSISLSAGPGGCGEIAPYPSKRRADRPACKPTHRPTHHQIATYPKPSRATGLHTPPLPPRPPSPAPPPPR